MRCRYIISNDVLNAILPFTGIRMFFLCEQINMITCNDILLIVKYAREQFNDQPIQKGCTEHGDGEQEERKTRGPKAKSASQRRKAHKIVLWQIIGVLLPRPSDNSAAAGIYAPKKAQRYDFKR
ncbi:MAG: hypothetical protein QG575_307 [Euryarchaeota archaeon]|nr:hypothetical protein [Euryarchaeota archaeon]